jgi:hypothetical protein
VTRRRAITEDVGYFVDLGLGRGVDATEEKPWLNRSTFQVRQVSESNILGTEEGDLIRGFVNEVESTQLLQASLRASVTASELVNIGVDSELSRKVSESQKSVGEKIVTRTISFRTDFKNVNEGKRPKTEQKGGDVERCVSEQTFESLLKKWIDDRHDEDRKNEEYRYPWKTRNKGSSTSTLTEEKIKEYCTEFVEKYSITHYVQSLELGASYYFTLSEKEFETKVRSKISASGRGAGASVTSEGGFKRKNLQEEATIIGRMTPLRKSDPKSNSQDLTVRRGTTDEAVVGVKLQPITSLVQKSVALRRILQRAVQQYIDDHQNVKCMLECMP